VTTDRQTDRLTDG